jgi:hypothetical protein
MFIGQTLVAENYQDDSVEELIIVNPSTVYVPWMPRGGNDGEFSFEVIAISNRIQIGTGPVTALSEPELTIAIFTKNSEEVDDDVNQDVSGASQTVNSPGIVKIAANDLKELVRIRYVLTDTAGADEMLRTYYAILRALAPSWVTN